MMRDEGLKISRGWGMLRETIGSKKAEAMIDATTAWSGRRSEERRTLSWYSKSDEA